MIWNESIECMDRESLRKIQSIRLKKIVDYVYHNTPFYRKKMQEMGITPDDINSIDDIVKLPFTTKHDLRDNYPFGLCAVPMSQIVRIHASSGTTGKPTVVEPVTCSRLACIDRHTVQNNITMHLRDRKSTRLNSSHT